MDDLSGDKQNIGSNTEGNNSKQHQAQLYSIYFRELFYNSIDAIAILSEEGTYEICNHVHEQMFGKHSKKDSPATFIGEKKFEKILTEINNAGRYYGEVFFKKETYNKRWFDLHAFKIKNENKQIKYVFIKRDITDRKIREEILSDREEQFRSVWDITLDAMCICDTDGVIVNINPSFIRNFGYDKIHLLGSNYFDLIPGEERQKFVELYHKGFETQEQVFVINSVILAKSEEARKIEVQLGFLNKKNKKIASLLVIRDITDKKVQEEKLKFSESNLVEAQRIGKMGSWSIELDNNKMWWSSQTYRIFGYLPKEKEPGNILNEHLHPDDKEMYYNELIKIIENNPEQSIQYDFRIHDKKGKVHYLRTAGILKEKKRLVGIFQDISEVKENEKELIRAKEKAEGSDRLKTAFLSNMSHEIRTPMNSIIGFTRLLDLPSIEDEKKKSYYNYIVDSTNQLLHIVEDIIRISSLDSGQEKIVKKVASINSIIREVYDDFEPKALEKNLGFKFHLPLKESDALIRLDDIKLVHILKYLLSNAFKFTYSGNVNVGYSLKGREIEFYVKDKGIGIKEEHKGLVYERFWQADSGHTRKYGGNGLGLAIVKEYVKMMGGNIWFESILGEGTTFYFTIPYDSVNNNEGSVKIEDKDKKGLLEGLSILIAEDEFVNYAFIKELLRRYGAKVTQAANGVEAVQICKEEKIDCVLMDLRMPVMDGYEATRKIRQDDKKIPIIALTAFAFQQHKDEALKSGFDYYIPKPVNKDLLITMIKRLVKKGK